MVTHMVNHGGRARQHPKTTFCVVLALFQADLIFFKTLSALRRILCVCASSGFRVLAGGGHFFYKGDLS